MNFNYINYLYYMYVKTKIIKIKINLNGLSLIVKMFQ